jgi:hypothetical protein
MLKLHGRVPIVVPNNVLFEGGADKPQFFASSQPPS